MNVQFFRAASTSQALSLSPVARPPHLTNTFAFSDSVSLEVLHCEDANDSVLAAQA
jgi:hypothetical protein